MAKVLDELGLPVLWERIRQLIQRCLNGNAGETAQGRILLAGGGGAMTTPQLSARLHAEILWQEDLEETDPRGQTRGDAWAVALSGHGDVPLREENEILLSLDGILYALPRRPGTAQHERSYAVFGNTKYSGIISPPVDGRADIGDPLTLIQTLSSGLCTLFLPDSHAHVVQLQKRSDVLVQQGTPEQADDVITLGVFESLSPVISGTGNGSARQRTADSSASGRAAMAGGSGTASGDHACALNGGIAEGAYSLACGMLTRASGEESHAEGYETEALGSLSHAEGGGSRASGRCAHAQGRDTLASGENQTVFGRWNEEDTQSRYAEIAGNGTSQQRSNARTLDWDGNEVLAGSLTAQAVLLRAGDGTYRLTVRNGELQIEREEEE